MLTLDPDTLLKLLTDYFKKSIPFTNGSMSKIYMIIRRKDCIEGVVN